MSLFADLALQVRPLPGYCIDSTDGVVWYVRCAGDGDPRTRRWPLVLTPQMLADVLKALMSSGRGPLPYDYGMSWIFEDVSPVGLRAVLTDGEPKP